MNIPASFETNTQSSTQIQELFTNIPAELETNAHSNMPIHHKLRIHLLDSIDLRIHRYPVIARRCQLLYDMYIG